MYDNDINMAVLNNIRTARKRANLKQSEMAKLLHMTPNTYSRMERGNAFITVARLYRIARILGVSATDLIALK